MGEREAKRRACGIASQVVESYTREIRESLHDLPLDDRDKVSQAVDELIVELNRRSQDCAPGA